jgi:hypothetical protein
MRTGTWAGRVVGGGRRALGLAFGKAVTFTYAVIVSLAANVVYELVREPPHPAPTTPQPASAAAIVPVLKDAPAARAALPAVPARAATAVVTTEIVRPASAAAADPSRPGPGSGGLY